MFVSFTSISFHETDHELTIAMILATTPRELAIGIMPGKRKRVIRVTTPLRENVFCNSPCRNGERETRLELATSSLEG